MSSQTDKLPPLPINTPFDVKGEKPTSVWNQWFIRLKAKVDVINASLVNLLGTSTSGILATNGSGSWFSRTLTAISSARIVITNGNGAAGNPTIDLAASGVTAATYGNSTNVAQFTTDIYGRIISAANVAISFPSNFVTSVGLAAPSFLTVSGSPVTSSGTLTLSLANQAQNQIFASPSGVSGTPSFRAMALLDLPSGVGQLAATQTWTGANTYSDGLQINGINANGGHLVLSLNGTGYNAILRNDNNNFYVLLSGSSGGSYNSLRPLIINTSTGALGIDGTGAGTSFGGQVTVSTNGSANSIRIIDGGASGANLLLVGNGTTTPNKTIRSQAGTLQVINSAYTAAILELTDAGTLSTIGTITNNIGTVAAYSNIVPSSLTVGASPWVYQNTNAYGVFVYFSGLTLAGTSLQISKDNGTYFTVGDNTSISVYLPPGFYFKLTYTTPPTASPTLVPM